MYITAGGGPQACNLRYMWWGKGGLGEVEQEEREGMDGEDIVCKPVFAPFGDAAVLAWQAAGYVRSALSTSGYRHSPPSATFLEILVLNRWKSGSSNIPYVCRVRQSPSPLHKYSIRLHKYSFGRAETDRVKLQSETHHFTSSYPCFYSVI